MLAPALRDTIDTATLQSEYESMFSHAGDTRADEVKVLGTSVSWPTKEAGDIGWAYVSISAPDRIHGGRWNEAVAVVVSDVSGQPLIGKILFWGRP
jgi:hypothetical protein